MSVFEFRFKDDDGNYVHLPADVAADVTVALERLAFEINPRLVNSEGFQVAVLGGDS